MILFVFLGYFDLTGFITNDKEIRKEFNKCLIVQSIGIYPIFINNLLSNFLAMEGKGNRTTIASILYLCSNIIFHYLFTVVLDMGVISRIMVSASIGEEDRQTLTDSVRVIFYRFFPILVGLSLIIFSIRKPLASLFFRDTLSSVYDMTVMGIGILSLTIPFNLIHSVFSCYGQASGKEKLLNVYFLFDGLIWMVVFVVTLLPSLGILGA